MAANTWIKLVNTGSYRNKAHSKLNIPVWFQSNFCHNVAPVVSMHISSTPIGSKLNNTIDSFQFVTKCDKATRPGGGLVGGNNESWC